MNSKSLVNGSIIKSDLRRYWYMGALFAVMLLLVTALPIHNYYSTGVSGVTTLPFKDCFFLERASAALFPIIIFSVTIPALIFSYLHHRSAVNAMHCLPLSRGTLYISHLISAAALIVAAIAVNAIIMISALHAWVPASYILKWAALSLIYCFVLMSFSAMASMLVGNTAAAIILPYIVLALPLFVSAIASFLCEIYLYGFTHMNDWFGIDRLYLSYSQLMSGWVLLYIGLGILFLALGLLAYKKRALENNSRILAFDFINPIFMYSFALCLGFCGCVYLLDFISIETRSMWLALPFGIAGVIIAKMIINKSFKPKGFVLPAIIYCLMMCIIYLLVAMDITGYEKRVPDASEVASINVIGFRYDNNLQNYDNNGQMMYLSENAKSDLNIYDKADIEKVIALHNAITVSGESDTRNQKYIPIEYTLTNGKKMYREYNFDTGNGLLELYGKVCDIRPVKVNQFPIISDAEPEYMSGSVDTMGYHNDVFDGEQLKAITEALRKDVEASKYDDYARGEALTRVVLSYRLPSVYEDGTVVPDKNMWIQNSVQYNIYPSYTNTIALLTSWGRYHKMPSVADIKTIRMYNLHDEDAEKEKVVQYGYNMEGAENVTDKAQTVLDYLRNNPDHLCQMDDRNASQRFEIDYINEASCWIAVDERVVE